MLNNWDGQLRLRKDYVSVLEKYCDELIEAIGEDDDSEGHFLLEARESSRWECFPFRNREKKELAKEAHGDFIEAIYSNDFKKFVEHFFGNIAWKQSYADPRDWDFWLSDFDGAYDIHEGYEAFDPLADFLGEICEPNQTYIEIQFLEDDGLPYRHVLRENKSWETRYPRLVWDDE